MLKHCTRSTACKYSLVATWAVLSDEVETVGDHANTIIAHVHL
jgi:hypothetical protein